MRWISWLSRKEKKESAAERAELNEAQMKVEDLQRRTDKLKRDNHFVANVKKVLGAQ